MKLSGSVVLSKATPAAAPKLTHAQSPKPLIVPTLLSFALSFTINTFSSPPSLAIPSPYSQTSPFSQSKDLVIGLDDSNKIRPCPSSNPSCISTNPKSSLFEFPWMIPQSDLENAIQKLEEAIMKTQKNVKIEVMEEKENGKYVEAEVDGGFGRDVMEFLVKSDVVTYRIMATKVTYVYPFTTAFGDSKGQQQRLKQIVDNLGWYAPSFDSMED